MQTAPRLQPATVSPELRQDIVRWTAQPLQAVLARQSQAYPLIDTKFDIFTGEDFPASDPIRGKNAVYCWIQGRGLESLAMHARWLQSEPTLESGFARAQLERIDALLPRIVERMESIRALRNGRLPFVSSPQGDTGETLGKSTILSDLFYAKGLAAAAAHLHDAALMQAAETLFAEVCADIKSGAFQLGQVALDPKNPVQHIPGRNSHAGRMISIGAATLFLQVTGKDIYRSIGTEFIRHIVRYHTATTQPELPQGLAAGDFWEFITPEGRPWQTPQGQLLSDPGHATEFVGLALNHLLHCSHSESNGNREAELEGQLRRILIQNFTNGFHTYGLVKTYDLLARTVVNSDMPWWSLPETIRAAALAAATATDAAERATLEQILLTCCRSFKSGYVLPERNCMAIQCLDKDGQRSLAIPATPDADPGYHTGLSLIGALQWLSTETSQL